MAPLFARVAALLVAVAVATTLVSACGAPAGEDTGSTSDAICTESYDWHDFPGGHQCVGGVDAFFQAHFGVSLPGVCQYPSANGCASCGACEFWVANAPDPNQWDRITGGTPQLFDMIVFPPPSSSNPYGHVAIVDHVGPGGVYVMDDNYVGYLQKASCPHTVSWAPYGRYRLKALEAPPPSPARGSLDAVSCDAISGWAQDPGSAAAAIPVDVYLDGPAGTGAALGRFTAGAARPDLCGAIGSCNHAFTIPPPTSLYDGHAHTVYVYGIAVTAGANDAILAGAPKTLHCAAAVTGNFEGTGHTEVVQFRDDWQTLPACGRFGSTWSCEQRAATYVGGLGAGNGGTAIFPGGSPLVGDVNGDGRDDIIQWSPAWESLPVCFSGSEGWSCKNLDAHYVGGHGAGNGGSGIYGAAVALVGDVNGDGRSDIIQYDSTGASLPVCFATDTGWSCQNLSASYVGGLGAGNAGGGIFGGEGTIPFVADVNGDGKADIVQYNPAWSSIPVCFASDAGWSCENLPAEDVTGQGAGNHGSGVYAATTVRIGDVNGDGKTDIVQYNPAWDTIPVCLSTGTGWSCENLKATYVGGIGAGNRGSGVYGASAVIVADVNGDGRADVVQYDPTWGSIPVCFATDEGWSCENLVANLATGAKAILPNGVPMAGTFDGGRASSILEIDPDSGWTTLPSCALDSTGWSCSNAAATVQ